MFLPLDTCCDLDRGQILTTTDTPFTCALVGARGGKWGSRVDWEKSFVFIFGAYSQENIQCIFLHHRESLIMRGVASGGELLPGHVRRRLESRCKYER